MGTRRYVSPLRYPGGKARMAPYLARMFAGQDSIMDVEVWVEPFAGGAGAGLTMLDRDLVPEVWLTEKNPAIAAMWRAVLGDGERLARLVETATPDMALWESSRAAVASNEAGEDLDDLELGFAALVLNRCSRSGIVAPRVGPIGGKGQTGRWTIASRWNGDGLAERIRHVASLAGRIRFTEGDAIVAIADLDGSGIEDEVLLFVDPPYLREGNRLYSNGMTQGDHQRLADALNASPARWLLTYDDEPLVPDILYPERRVLAYQIPNTANRARIATEYAVLSDSLYLPADAELLPGATAAWVRSVPAPYTTVTPPADATSGPEDIARLVEQIHQRSGLAWAELGRMIGTGRHAVRCWAVGVGTPNPPQLETLHEIGAEVARLDAGDRLATRAALLAPGSDGYCVVDTFRRRHTQQLLVATGPLLEALS